MMDYQPTRKHRSLVEETSDRQSFKLEGTNTWADHMTANHERYNAELRRIAAEGLRRQQGFSEHLIATFNLTRDDANKAVGRVALAEHEYQGQAWKVLFDASVSAVYRRALFRDLLGYATLSVERGLADSAGRERFDELIGALKASGFWTDALTEIFSRVDNVNPDDQQGTGLTCPEEKASEIEPQAATEIAAATDNAQADEERVDPDAVAAPPESLSVNAEQRDVPSPRRRRFDHRRADAQDAAAGAAEAIAPPVNAEPPRKRRPDERVSSPGAARMIGIKSQTLRAWRLKGIGPAYTRIGDPLTGRVVYEVAEIERWITARTHSSTSEETMNISRKR